MGERKPGRANKKEREKLKRVTLKYALDYLRLGLSVIPLAWSTKTPVIEWKEYQKRLPTREEIESWFNKDLYNIAIICGSVSQGLLVVDFDNYEYYKNWCLELPEEWKKILSWTWIARTGRGAHVYFRYKRALRTKPKLREGIDIKAEASYVVAPPSLHPSGVFYEFINGGPGTPVSIYELNDTELNELKRLLGWEEERKVVVKTPLEKGRDLKDEECLRIYTLLSDAYKPGYRDLIILFLTGWLRRANISYDSARRVVELLAKDDEELESRIYVLDRTYGIRGNPPTKEELKGKSGLLEVLTEVIGEEKALEVIKELENILGTASPYADAIIELLDYDKQIYGVCNFRRLIIARARRTENGFRYMERITIGAPTKLIVYFNPLGGLTKYEVLWESETRRPLRIGPCNIEDIAGRLRAEGLVLHPRLLEGVLNAIFEAFLRRGRAEIREEIEAPGFYYIDDKIVVVRYETEGVDLEELKNSLELLDTLGYWYSHALDRFSVVVKWGVVAPFIFARKQRGKWIPWLYLYGTSYTGKTTLALIVLHLYGLPISQYQKSGANIDTVPRLGYVLSRSTFPTLVNEPGSAITKEQITEVMKSAIESTTARGRYVRGTYTEIPSLSPLIMTSNKILPREDALLRRFIVLRFTYGERISKEKAREFDRTIKPRLKELEVIGKWVAKRIIEDPSILEEDDWLAIAERLLTEMYESIGLTPPEWIKLRVEEEENIYEDMREAIRIHLVRRVNEEFNRFVGRILVEASERPKSEATFEDRLNVVLSEGLIPYIIWRNEGTIVFTSGFREELRNVIGDIGGMKSIAELLGWEYKVVKVKKRPIKAIITKYQDLLEFLKVE